MFEQLTLFPLSEVQACGWAQAETTSTSTSTVETDTAITAGESQ